MSVLVVDDSKCMRDLLTFILKSQGVKVCVATDGNDAMIVLSHEPTIRAVISDVEMPKMDGLQLLALVKAVYPQIPVFLTTAGERVSRAEANARGAAGFFRKPIDKGALLTALGGTSGHARHCQ